MALTTVLDGRIRPQRLSTGVHRPWSWSSPGTRARAACPASR